MTTYKVYETFAECKLAHPDRPVYVRELIGNNSFSPTVVDIDCVEADASEHLVDIKSFLDGGHSFNVGDSYLDVSNKVVRIDHGSSLLKSAESDSSDYLRYVLKAAALESSPTQHLEQQRAKARFDASIDATLAERGSRYGEFEDGAAIMQSLKGVMKSTDGWSRLSPSQREALEMIQHKIGRILNGDPNYADSWVDIAGYAKLIGDNLESE